MKTQEEIGQLAWKFYVDKDGIVPNTYESEGFVNGYTQCQENNKDKKYTEEDMIGFFEWSLGMEVVEMICHNKTKQEIFQVYLNSLKK